MGRERFTAEIATLSLSLPVVDTHDHDPAVVYGGARGNAGFRPRHIYRDFAAATCSFLLRHLFFLRCILL